MTEQEIATLKAERDSLRATCETLQANWLRVESELNGIRQSWWLLFREEISKPEYASFVAAKDAKGLFDYLDDKNIPQQLDPIPIADVRAAISGVMAELALNGNMNPEVKLTWRTLLLDQITIMGNASTVPAILVQGLVEKAIESFLLPEGAVIGSKLVSRLELLNLKERIKSPIDIAEAMRW